MRIERICFETREIELISTRLQSDEQFQDAIREPFLRLAAKHCHGGKQVMLLSGSKFSYS